MDVEAALLSALAAMVLWGSWANTLLLARARFELYFLDYAVGNAIVGALRLPSAATSLSRAAAASAWPQGAEALGVAAFAGLLYALGTLLLVNAVDLAGMALAVPLVLGSEFALGVPLLLLVEGPGTATHVALSLAGVVSVLCALCFDQACHSRLAADRAREGLPQQARASSLSAVSFYASLNLREEAQNSLALVGSGAADGLISMSRIEEASVTSRGGAGLLLAALAGAFFSVWPCLSSVSEGKGPLGKSLGLGSAALTPAAFYVVFVAAALATAMCVVPILARCPLDRSQPFAAGASYLALPLRAHLLGLLGGLAQGLGTLLSLQAGDALGNAAALSITRCSPVVAGLWGLCAWGELRGAGRRTMALFVAMVVAFLVAVGLLGLAGALAARASGVEAPSPLPGIAFLPDVSPAV